MSELNPRQRAFAEEYLVNGRNAKQAYIKVYKTKHITTAEVNGARLLSNAKVKQYIDIETKKQQDEGKYSKEKYLKILDRFADSEEGRSSLEAIKIIGKWQGFESPTQLMVKTVKDILDVQEGEDQISIE